MGCSWACGRDAHAPLPPNFQFPRSNFQISFSLQVPSPKRLTARHPRTGRARTQRRTSTNFSPPSSSAHEWKANEKPQPENGFSYPFLGGLALPLRATMWHRAVHGHPMGGGRDARGSGGGLCALHWHLIRSGLESHAPYLHRAVHGHPMGGGRDARFRGASENGVR